jgi:hypothetical protein
VDPPPNSWERCVDVAGATSPPRAALSPALLLCLLPIYPPSAPLHTWACLLPTPSAAAFTSQELARASCGQMDP